MDLHRRIPALPMDCTGISSGMPMNPQSDRLTDVIFVIFGVAGLGIAIARLGNNIDYLPADPRSQPWFDPLVSSIMAAFAIFFLVVGVVRLFRNRGGRAE